MPSMPETLIPLFLEIPGNIRNLQKQLVPSPLPMQSRIIHQELFNLSMLTAPLYNSRVLSCKSYQEEVSGRVELFSIKLQDVRTVATVRLSWD